jgi:hypothetical protein
MSSKSPTLTLNLHRKQNGHGENAVAGEEEDNELDRSYPVRKGVTLWKII